MRSDLLNLKTYFPTFRIPINTISGIGSVKALSGLSATRVVVIGGASIINCLEFRTYLEDSIRIRPVDFILKSWPNEPSFSGLKETVNSLERIGPDVIIAVGGGSVIDGARLAWLFYEHPYITRESLSGRFQVPKMKGKSKFVAIPTTVGTGSETSSAAIIIDEDKKNKIPIVTHDFIPDLVILDPTFLTNLSKNVIASTSIDAISHILEGYVSRLKNPIMDSIAEKSLSIIFEHHLKAIDKNILALEQLQIAAYMGGIVQNHCMTGACHALAHQLGQFHIGHGHANSIFLPSVINYNSQDVEVKGRYSRIAQHSSIGSSPDDLVRFIRSYAELGGLEIRLNHLTNFKPKSIDNLIKLASMDLNAKMNPVDLNESSLKEIFMSCL